MHPTLYTLHPTPYPLHPPHYTLHLVPMLQTAKGVLARVRRGGTPVALSQKLTETVESLDAFRLSECVAGAVALSLTHTHSHTLSLALFLSHTLSLTHTHSITLTLTHSLFLSLSLTPTRWAAWRGIKSAAHPLRATRGPLWGYLKSQFSRDLVKFWR